MKTLEERFWSKVNKNGPVHPVLGTPCWLWTGARDSRGYGHFCAHGKTSRATRFALEIAHGPVSRGLLACHRCDNPPCVNSEHLFLGTYLDNMRDAKTKGRTASGARNGTYTHPETRGAPTGDAHWTREHPSRVLRGETHGMARLTARDVETIRADYATGAWSHRTLGRRFGVSHTQIDAIVKFRRWANAPSVSKMPEGT